MNHRAAAKAALNNHAVTKRKRSVSQLLLHILFGLASILTILPIILVFSISISDETSIYTNGYSFIPSEFSMAAYSYLWQDGGAIIRSYSVTIMVTIIGSVAGLLMMTLFAYPISRRDFPYRNVFSFFVFFTMLFSGGLVPWYLVYSNVIDLKDSVWALVVPNLLMNGFNILIIRTFFQNSIPPSLIESATIDGAGELRIWWKIIMPLSMPVLATIGLFSTLAYWNDWFNSLIFISDARWYSLQYVMQKMLLDVLFLSQQSGNGNSALLLATMPSETVRMAMAIIGAGPIVLAYPFFQRYLVQGLTIGAVKG